MRKWLVGCGGLLALVVLVVGCGGGEGGQDPADVEPTQGLGDESENISIDPNSPLPPEGQIEFFRLECQTAKAESDGYDTDALFEGLGEVIAAEQFPETAPAPRLDPEIQQDLAEGKTIPDILEEAGYTCTDREIREMQDEAKAQAKEQAERAQQEAQEAQAKSGKNEAGQDVSNTPVLSPEERRAEGECLNEYYRSLPPDHRGSEQQRVVAEANDRGTTPGAVVGCDREAGLSPAELDVIHEKPSSNPKSRAAQCGPQSNASPAFREKYC